MLTKSHMKRKRSPTWNPKVASAIELQGKGTTCAPGQAMSRLALVTGFTLFMHLAPRLRAGIMIYLASCSQNQQVSDTRFTMNESMSFPALTLFKRLMKSYSKYILDP